MFLSMAMRDKHPSGPPQLGPIPETVESPEDYYRASVAPPASLLPASAAPLDFPAREISEGLDHLPGCSPLDTLIEHMRRLPQVTREPHLLDTLISEEYEDSEPERREFKHLDLTGEDALQFGTLELSPQSSTRATRLHEDRELPALPKETKWSLGRLKDFMKRSGTG